MNSAAVLAYNFSDQRLQIVQVLCMALKIKLIEVPVTQYEEQIGALLGIPGMRLTGAEYAGECFADEMLLLASLDSEQLSKFVAALKKMGLGNVEFKAVLTEVNKDWHSLRLYVELKAERDELARGEG